MEGRVSRKEGRVSRKEGRISRKEGRKDKEKKGGREEVNGGVEGWADLAPTQSSLKPSKCFRALKRSSLNALPDLVIMVEWCTGVCGL